MKRGIFSGRGRGRKMGRGPMEAGAEADALTDGVLGGWRTRLRKALPMGTVAAAAATGPGPDASHGMGHGMGHGGPHGKRRASSQGHHTGCKVLDDDLPVLHQGKGKHCAGSGQRCGCAPTSRAPNLDEAPMGAHCRVLRLVGCGAVRQRLLDLGLQPRRDVHVIRAAPLRDPIELRVGDTFIALRRREAAQVEIEFL
ncbi:FeoA family protein [Phaeovulum vinaykumarii]|uniref:Fe2+ transport system protein FeoA n=1 Tax=Phaeovulum vinaykumarii TaxID=407234 RepID=A0A1N7LAI7_9RHOB|nr:FeoA family protein [Phaeovulum vinaykumarii]SIS70876.1 Fe2+ transport system protein FeoA [Phaeovulum vinaykumarii]SOB98671.1 Fe2+ transport system protein FeoA [Phaeovulum vinaykumarii]